MGLLQLMTAFLPMKIISLVSLIAILVLMPIQAGLGMGRVGTYRCVGDDCLTVYQDRVDFKTAEATCRDRNGEPMAFQSEASESILEILRDGAFGNLWIGLRLADGVCSNLSAPLRGYEWSTGSMHRHITPPWKDSVQVCSPRCVSLSNDQKWTERPCSDKVDGFVCITSHRDARQARAVSDPHVFQSPEGCSDAPCEHKCTAVERGYKCSCYNGYIPSSQDPHLCQMHCAAEKCPMLCERDGETCFCPKGFIGSDKSCIDIDECEMQYCAQECKNSYGSFVCSCQEGFVLKDKVKCVRGDEYKGFTTTTPFFTDFTTPAVNKTLKVSSATAGGFLWVWIVMAVGLLVLIFAVRSCVVRRQERSEPRSQQRPAVDAENTYEC